MSCHGEGPEEQQGDRMTECGDGVGLGYVCLKSAKATREKHPLRRKQQKRAVSDDDGGYRDV